jgi:hypothetical protein
MPKYLLLKHYRGGPAPHHPYPPLDQWAPEDREAHFAFMGHVTEILKEKVSTPGCRRSRPHRRGCATGARTPGRSLPVVPIPRSAT